MHTEESTLRAADLGPDLRHHGDAEVRDDGAALVDLAVRRRAAPVRRRIADHATGTAPYLPRDAA